MVVGFRPVTPRLDGLDTPATWPSSQRADSRVFVQFKGLGRGTAGRLSIAAPVGDVGLEQVCFGCGVYCVD